MVGAVRSVTRLAPGARVSVAHAPRQEDMNKGKAAGNVICCVHEVNLVEELAPGDHKHALADAAGCVSHSNAGA